MLSDRKLNDGALTYVVPEAPGIRATENRHARIQPAL